jgi:hypothetical protein
MMLSYSAQAEDIGGMLNPHATSGWKTMYWDEWKSGMDEVKWANEILVVYLQADPILVDLRAIQQT